MNNHIKKEKGITLIALVITIIVLLILAGVSIAMLTGENGLIKKAGEASKNTNKCKEVEQARLDIMAIITEKRGENPNEKEIKKVIEKYFVSVPEDLEDLTQELITKEGNNTVKLSDILEGVTYTREVIISKSTQKTDSYVGCYADIDDDGEIDGIIYADMLVGNTGSGNWNNGVCGVGNPAVSTYNIPKIEDVSSVKDYSISFKVYKGQSSPGIYKENNGFGTKEVIVPASKGNGTVDRFYVMTLKDFTTNSMNYFYWYKNAYGKLDRPIQNSEEDFGEGKKNTIDMLNDWNNNTDVYGEQTTTESGEEYIDLWGAIQDGQYDLVTSTTDSGKWFVPSRTEWCAFCEELGIKGGYHTDKGLWHRQDNIEDFGFGWRYPDGHYWTSTQSLNQYCATDASPAFCGVQWFGMLIVGKKARLSATY